VKEGKSENLFFINLLGKWEFDTFTLHEARLKSRKYSFIPWKLCIQ